MGITLHYTDIDTAETKDNWEVVGDGEGLEDSNYPPKQGSQCIGWECKPNSHGGVRNKNAVSGFDIRIHEAGVWFLNPVADNDGNVILDSVEDGVYLRLYSGSNYANYFQPQHRKSDGNWRGGWLYLKAAGAAGSENSHSGTWGTNQVSNIDRICIMVKTGSGDTTDKNSGNFGTDWGKYYDKIVITGDNSGEPWTMNDVYNIDVDKNEGGGVWGITKKAEDFYEVNYGIEFGDGNNGSFKMENEYLFLNQLDIRQKYNIKIKAGFTVTLGVKDTGEMIYAKNGSNITATGLPTLTVENNARLYVYDSKIQGFELLRFGQGGSADVEVVKSDLYNNDFVEFNSSSVLVKNSRLYFPESNRGDVGVILVRPIEMNNIKIFNAVTGLDVKVDMDMVKLSGYGNDYDIAIEEGKTVYLEDSIIDGSKIKRT